VTEDEVIAKVKELCPELVVTPKLLREWAAAGLIPAPTMVPSVHGASELWGCELVPVILSTRLADRLRKCRCGHSPHVARLLDPIGSRSGVLVFCPECERYTDPFPTIRRAFEAWKRRRIKDDIWVALGDPEHSDDGSGGAAP
jgi:hypothetical protein